MSFEFFVDDDPLSVGMDPSDDDETVASSSGSPSTTSPAAAVTVPAVSKEAITMEIDGLKDSEPSKHAPGVFFPALGYLVTVLVLALTSEYGKLVIHVTGVAVAFGVERLRESIVRQMKLDEVGDESLLGVALYTVPLVIWYKTYQICFAQPVNYLLQAMGSQVDLVDIDQVPMARRKQTMAVLLWSMMVPMVLPAYGLAFMLTLVLPFVMVPYLIWIYFIDTSSRDGSRKASLRDISFAKHFVDYFPITLERASPPLDPSRKYVFGFHPHGIISLSAIGALGSNAAGFQELFPGIERRLLTLDTNFRVPFLREIILSLGVCSVTRKSCDAILRRGPGSAIIIVPGGAAEALETQEGTYRLVLNRKGFVRVAIENDADLVPVFAFGETDVFSVLVPEKDSRLRKWQLWAQKKMGFGIPIFWGRGIMSYNWGFLPKRKPINVVTGPPVQPRLFREKGLEGDALVNAVHEEYVQAVKRLFDAYKDRTEAGKARTESITLVE